MLRRWRIEACPRIWSKHDATRFNDNEVVFKWPLIMHLSRTVSGIHKKIVRRWSGAWARFARLENIEKGIEFELVLARRATGKINRPSNRRKSLPKHLFVAQHIRHEFVSNKILYIYCNEIIHRAWDSWNLRKARSCSQRHVWRKKKIIRVPFKEIARVRNASRQGLEMHFRFNRQLYSHREIMMILLCPV